MGIIVKSNTFSGFTNPQLPWLDSDFDGLFTLVNGELDNANIASNAAIAQSKIADLLTSLAARVNLAGDLMTGRLDIKMSVPYVRLIGTEGSASDWRVAESAGIVYFQLNTGTEAIPVWTTRFTLANAGTPLVTTDLATKGYVDTLIATLPQPAIGKVVKTNADFQTTSTSYVAVTGAAVSITTLARRVRVTVLGMFTNLGGSSFAHVGLSVDGVNVETDAILAVNGSANDEPMSFTYITDALTAAAHTFALKLKSSAGDTVQVTASAERPVILWAEELVNV